MINLFATLLGGLYTEHYKALQCVLFRGECPASLEELAVLSQSLKETWDGRYTQHLPTQTENALVFEVDYDSLGGIGSLQVELFADHDHIRVSEMGHYESLRTIEEVTKFLELFK